MKKTREQKGITLTALIITIVIVLILAVVTVSSLINNGILSYATNGAKDYSQTVVNEQEHLDDYSNYLDNKKTVSEAKNKVLSKISNTVVYDEHGNKIVVPAGFRIKVDSTTNNANTVTEGIVVEDSSGNEFVWIPVGTIKHLDQDGNKTTTTITLGRYLWNGSIGTLEQPTADSSYTSNVEITTEKINYTEYQSSNAPANKQARNINNFYESAIKNNGYYLGRYEAGNLNGIVVCKAEQAPYNNMIQSTAASLAQAMYEDGFSSGTFSSDLINSYAWDTAIIFIQTFGTKSNSSTYASTSGKALTGTRATTGTNILNSTGEIDEQLNIYDMAGNCFEWSTETCSSDNAPCVRRGGYYNTGSGRPTSDRYGCELSADSSSVGFRPLLYVS